EPDLRIEYYTEKAHTAILPEAVQKIKNDLQFITRQTPVTTSFEKQLNISINNEKLLLYNIPYNTLYQTLKSGFKENEITTLRSYQQYLPITLGRGENNVREVVDNTLIPISGIASKVPLNELISVNPTEDIKTIIAGRNGEFIPFDFYQIDNPQ